MKEPSTVEEFSDGREQAKKILGMHYDGMTPTEIDAELGLPSGTAKRTIVEYWKFDDSWYRYSKYQKRTGV